MTRQRILILSPAPIARSPRVLKQVRALRDRFDIVTASRGESPFPDIEHVVLPAVDQRFGRFGRLVYLGALVVRAYPLITHVSAADHAVREALGAAEWDLVIAHDVQTVTVAEQLRSRHGVLVDLHEYAPRQNDHSRNWRMLIAPYFRHLIRGPVRRARAATTVSQGIVDEYRRAFGLDTTLIINASPYRDLDPTQVHTPLRLVHSGVAAAHRHLEILIDAFAHTDAAVTLDFYLVGLDTEYGRQLQARAASDTRIRFHDAVPYDELITTLNAHDVGVHILPPVNFNHMHALPNKLFDYVQARLGVLTGPSPEMAAVVRTSGVGAVTGDFTSQRLADAIDALAPDQVEAWKRASAAHARALSSEEQMDRLTELVDRLLDT